MSLLQLYDAVVHQFLISDQLSQLQSWSLTLLPITALEESMHGKQQFVIDDLQEILNTHPDLTRSALHITVKWHFIVSNQLPELHRWLSILFSAMASEGVPSCMQAPLCSYEELM